MADPELSIPNYQVIRLDCNCHGGVFKAQISLHDRQCRRVVWVFTGLEDVQNNEKQSHNYAADTKPGPHNTNNTDYTMYTK